jgi:hypothetical protein
VHRSRPAGGRPQRYPPNLTLSVRTGRAPSVRILPTHVTPRTCPELPREPGPRVGRGHAAHEGRRPHRFLPVHGPAHTDPEHPGPPRVVMRATGFRRPRRERSRPRHDLEILSSRGPYRQRRESHRHRPGERRSDLLRRRVPRREALKIEIHPRTSPRTHEAQIQLPPTPTRDPARDDHVNVTVPWIADPGYEAYLPPKVVRIAADAAAVEEDPDRIAIGHEDAVGLGRNRRHGHAVSRQAQ